MINWRVGPKMRENMLEFIYICSLPSIHGAIDKTHIAIVKSKENLEDYYYFKSEKYGIIVQSVVDAKKHFIHMYMGPSSL